MGAERVPGVCTLVTRLCACGLVAVDLCALCWYLFELMIHIFDLTVHLSLI